MTLYKETTACRLCKSIDIKTVLDFGETALANSFLNNPTDEEIFVPLSVFACQQCGSVQLRHTVDPDILFKNYLYESGTSATFRNHFKSYAAEVYNTYKPANVLDIGSNDGVLLKEFKELGCNVLGVEPATNLAKKANDNNLPTLNKFFNLTNAILMNTPGKFQVITANNVFAHIDDLHNIIDGVKLLLDDDGVFIFENAYLLDTIENLYFDQVYHEHLYYHTIAPLCRLFHQHGMSVVNVERNKIQGGTIRVFVKKGYHPLTEKLIKLIENELFLAQPHHWMYFNNKLKRLKEQFNKVLEPYVKNGTEIAAYGAPAKFTTFCKYMNLDERIIRFVVDDALLKQGKYTPGTNIAVGPKEWLYERQPKACVITAWNFAESIIKNNPDYKGEWIIPMPEVKVVTS